MHVTKCVYKDKIFRIYAENEKYYCLFSTDYSDFENKQYWFSIASSSNNQLYKFVKKEEVQLINEYDEIDFVCSKAIELCTRAIISPVPNGIAEYSLPLLIKNDKKFYGIYIISSIINSNHSLKPYSYLIFDLEDGKLLDTQLYSETILKNINSIFKINKIEVMYFAEKNLDKKDIFLDEFDKLRMYYKDNKKINKSEYKKYIKYFLKEIPNASAEEKNIIY